VPDYEFVKVTYNGEDTQAGAIVKLTKDGKLVYVYKAKTDQAEEVTESVTPEADASNSSATSSSEASAKAETTSTSEASAKAETTSTLEAATATSSVATKPAQSAAKQVANGTADPALPQTGEAHKSGLEGLLSAFVAIALGLLGLGTKKRKED
ncbi:hypothetical protein L1O48_05560, partial [Ligilactobacillus equi]|uniref:hypothetical protein n=1 Tax=Ligilactobacillus equi TaxID=137357 RepID=UPI002ED43EBF